MRNWLCLPLVIGVMLGGCIDANASKSNAGKKETQQKKPVQIKVSIYENYEDGFDLKMQLINAKNAKGNWTVRDCGRDQVFKNQGRTIKVGYGYSDCEIPIGHENDPSYNTDYINFTGTVDGKKVIVDKIYVLDFDEVEKVPEAGASSWVRIQTFLKTGYLFGTSIRFGASREDIIEYFGKPEPSVNNDYLSYKYVTFSLTNNRLDNITMYNTKEDPIDLPNKEKDDIIRVFGNPDLTYGEDDVYYSVYHLKGMTATFAWSNKESKLISFEVTKK